LLKLISQAALALPNQVYDPIISAVLVSESGVGLQNEGIHKMAQLYFRVWKRVPLLARGRDRLETALNRSEMGHIIRIQLKRVENLLKPTFSRCFLRISIY
jgi:hypothetical protein